jgi:hypothetical protein
MHGGRAKRDCTNRDGRLQGMPRRCSIATGIGQRAIPLAFVRDDTASLRLRQFEIDQRPRCVGLGVRAN